MLVPSTRFSEPSPHGSARQQDEPGVVKQPTSEQLQGNDEDDRWGLDWMANTAARRVKEKLGWKDGSLLGGSSSNLDSAVYPFSGARSSSSPSSFSLDEGDDLLSYRNHLEKQHSPHSYTKHSPTLTFGHIYVLSLPHRTDRRSRMGKIARALGLRFDFIDATSKDAPLIGWIAERVKEIRVRKKTILAQALGKQENEIGGMGVDSIWLKGQDHQVRLSFPKLETLDERWFLPADGVTGPDHMQQEVVDWVTYLEKTPSLDILRPSASPSMAAMNISDLLLDPIESLPARQVNDGVIATWYSHTRVWKKIVENDDQSALVLEDDTDLEWDIERTWPNVERALPKDWEIVFLGHCWGKELARMS